MNKKQFQAFFESKNFIVKGMKGSVPSAYGMIGDYPVIANFTGNKKWVLLLSVEMTSAKTWFKDLRKENKQFQFILNAQSLRAVIKVNDKSREEDWRQQTSELLTALRQKGVLPDSACGICGRGGCDTLMLWEGHYSPIHNHCVNAMEQQARYETEKNDTQGNYIAGIIGAILGAFVGVIPSLLTIIFMNSIWSVLFALIPLCICFGYKLFKGKANKFMIVVTIILSILSVFLIEFELLVYLFMSEYGIPFSDAMIITVEAIKYGDIMGELMVDMLQYFMFVALGIWIAWGQISKTNSSLVKGVNEVRSTMAPYNGSGAQNDMMQQNNMQQGNAMSYNVTQDVDYR